SRGSASSSDLGRGAHSTGGLIDVGGATLRRGHPPRAGGGAGDLAATRRVARTGTGAAAQDARDRARPPARGGAVLIERTPCRSRLRAHRATGSAGTATARRRVPRCA